MYAYVYCLVLVLFYIVSLIFIVKCPDLWIKHFISKIKLLLIIIMNYNYLMFELLNVL